MNPRLTIATLRAALLATCCGLCPNTHTLQADDHLSPNLPQVPSGQNFAQDNRTMIQPVGYVSGTVVARAAAASDEAEGQAEGAKKTEPVAAIEHVGPEQAAMEFIEFPEEHVPFRWHFFESTPHWLSKPVEPMGKAFAAILHTEHVQTETDLDEHAIGLQPVASRPKLLLEWNDEFLAPGELSQGIEIPTGAVWRPSLWMFGEQRSAIQYYDNQGPTEPVVEWANRLDLFGQVNLSGTERILAGWRPLDEELVGRREFTSLDLRNGNSIDGWNAEFQTLFFEGDFGEIFPWLDPFDTEFLDYGFSVGRMPLLAQQGLLINEDMIDALTVTRNTLNGNGFLNLRMTGVYAWNRINRNSAVSGPNEFDPDSSMFALLTESDFLQSTVNADLVYVVSEEDRRYGDLLAFGLSSIRRVYGYDNTYNLSTHLLASFPTDGTTNYAGQGELLFSQVSWTPHRTEDLIYLNSFLAIDQFTSPTRGPLNGGALGQTGIMFAAPGLGRAGPPIAVRTNDSYGASLGYQFFFDHTRQQLIWEVGGQKEYEGPDRGAIGTAMQHQVARGQHFIFVTDFFVAKVEERSTSQGARFEVRVKF